MQVVSPYRPSEPESLEHRTLGAFDWMAALGMLRASVARSCGCETFALTDRGCRLDVPAFTYRTTRRPLMLWILEVSLRFLQSDDFRSDTVMISPDMLVFGDLRPWFTADLGVLIRMEQKHAQAPLLNGVQWWSVAAKTRLVAFYRLALARAEALPASAHVWGADTAPLVELLAPLAPGWCERHGLRVHCIPHTDVLRGLASGDIARLESGRKVRLPRTPIVDFRFLRKRYMAAYFAATRGKAAAA